MKASGPCQAINSQEPNIPCSNRGWVSLDDRGGYVDGHQRDDVGTVRLCGTHWRWWRKHGRVLTADGMKLRPHRVLDRLLARMSTLPTYPLPVDPPRCPAIGTVCGWTGCARQAVLHPVLVLPPPRWSHPYPDSVALRCAMSVALCRECYEAANSEHFLTDAGWCKIVGSIRIVGRVMPQRGAARLSHCDLGSPECLVLHASMSPYQRKDGTDGKTQK